MSRRSKHAGCSLKVERETTLQRKPPLDSQLPACEILELPYGGFRCTMAECGWATSARLPDAGRRHAQGLHDERCFKIVPYHKRQPTGDDAKREKQRQQKRVRRALTRRIVHSGLGTHPMLISDKGGTAPVECRVSEGVGERVIRGKLDLVGLESMNVAITLVAANAAKLRSWLCPAEDDAPLPLYDDSTDLTLEFGKTEWSKSGTSGAAAAALEVACFLARRPVRAGDIAVTGTIDLRGRLGTVGGVDEKIRHAFESEGGVGSLVLPAFNYDHLKRAAWPEDLSAWCSTRLLRAAKLVDLLELTVEGFHGTREMAAVLDGPQVGVGSGLGLLEVDGVWEFEVQCMNVAPGRQALRLTGFVSEASRDALTEMMALVVHLAPRIAVALGLDPASVRRKLHVRGQNLHVHLKHVPRPLLAAYQKGVMFVALASMLVGRRARADTLCFFSVGSGGELECCADWEWSKRMVAVAKLLSFRRVVLAEGVRLSDEAVQHAEEMLEDGRWRLQVLRARTIDEALPLLFDEDGGNGGGGSVATG